MFLDVREGWPPPEPWAPRPAAPRLTKRAERVLGWIVAFNIAALVLAPLAGVTLIDALVAAFRG